MKSTASEPGLSERSEPFRPRNYQASDEVARGRPTHIKSDEEFF